LILSVLDTPVFPIADDILVLTFSIHLISTNSSSFPNLHRIDHEREDRPNDPGGPKHGTQEEPEHDRKSC
jgi:hypothetical protein